MSPAGPRARSSGGPAGRIVAALRGALWPLPTLGIAVALGLGVALPALDRALGLGTGQQSLAILFSGGPSAARGLLSAIATALISVTGLVFSLTVVALQLSSSQYSPRLLQTFVTDRVVQLTLAQLVLTFVYSLTVLRTIRTSNESAGEVAFVPGISITVASVLTLVSVVALVLFLAHLSRALRVDSLLRDVHREAIAGVARVLRDGGDDGNEDGGDATGAFLPPAAAVPVEANASGFLVAIDEKALARAAEEADLVLRLTLRVGDGVVGGTPIAHAWSTSPEGRVDPEQAARVLERGVHLGYERESTADFSYAVRKMVDIAVRALSPGINDPTTAVSALSHVSAVLVGLADQPLPPRCLRDGTGRVRVVVPKWDHAALLRLALEEPLQCSTGQPEVLRRIAGLLREVGWRAGPGPLAAELRRLAGRVADAATGSTDVAGAEAQQWQADVDAALAGRWPPTGTGAAGA